MSKSASLVSPGISFMPERFGELADADFVREGESVANRMAAGMKAVLDARAAIMSDPTRTPIANLARVKELADRRISQLLPEVDAYRARCQRRLAERQGQIAKALELPKDPHAVSIAAETRKALKDMSDEKRSKTLNEAIANDNRIVLAAVLLAPSLLTGFDPDHLEMFRDQYVRTHHAETSAEIAALEAAPAMLDRAARAAMAQKGQLVDVDQLAIANAAASAADAALLAAAREPDAAE